MDASTLTDDELIERLEALREDEQRTLRDFLACLGEADRRELLKKRGYSSSFDYCVRKLALSEDEAIKRLRTARAGRLYPEVLSRIDAGDANLTNVSRVAAHLTAQNVTQVLERIAKQPTREVEKIVAEFKPQPDKPDSIRALPAPAASVSRSAEFPRETLKPSAPGRLHVSFTASEEFERIIERAKDLLWHKFPAGRLEDLVTEFGKYWLAGHDPGLKLKPAPERSPRAAQSRRVPRWVRDKVWRRDGGRCACVGRDGDVERRCEATRGLEFDHARPWAAGGNSDDPENIRLLCRAHNQLRGREMFG